MKSKPFFFFWTELLADQEKSSFLLSRSTTESTSHISVITDTNCKIMFLDSPFFRTPLESIRGELPLEAFPMYREL